MLTREQILDAFKQAKGADATEYVLAVGRAIEQAARREALGGAIAALSKRVMGDKSEGDFETQRCIEAIRALMGEEG